MGANDFYDIVFGKTLDEAFRSAVEQALYDYGHAGYTGSIAEKGSVVEIPLKEIGRKDREKYADDLMHNLDPRVSDKWGDAGAISLKGTKKEKELRERNNMQRKKGNYWIFFGSASS